MKLRLGLPKGSLQEATFALFGRAGFHAAVASRSYQPTIDDPTIDPVLLRPQEIPRFIEAGIIDAGLTGQDWVADCRSDLQEICVLQYSKATSNPIRIVVAVHQDSPYQSSADLNGTTIATEYLNLTKDHLTSQGVQAKVEFSWGACEVKVPSVVEAIVVNTETGNSLRAHNLRIIDQIMESRTVLVCSHSAWADSEKRAKLESLRILLEGAMAAASRVGLKMNVPVGLRHEIASMLPALKAPTVTPLEDADWCAMEVILHEKEARDLIPRLKQAGATGLVEYPLNKVVD
ncbi:MAG: ATP phosphoribosyltransferase [bacterium]